MFAQSERREYRLQPWRPRAHVDGLRRGYSAPAHDENYKRLFSFPRMIEDLVRILVAENRLDEFDFNRRSATSCLTRDTSGMTICRRAT